ncbi:MAG: DMT family transporter [Chloroflexota bacterium]
MSGRYGGSTLVAAALMVLMWGSSPVATKIGLASYQPGQWTLLRFLVTSAAMLVIAVVTRLRPPRREDILPMIGLGMIGISVNQLCFSFAMQHVDAGTATFLVATVPVMTAILARVVLQERLTPAGWAGIGLTVAGTAVLVLGQGRNLSFTAGALTLLLGAFSEAIYYIFQKPMLRKYGSSEVSAWTLIASTIPLLIFLPGFLAQAPVAAPAHTWLGVYAGLGAGVIGYLCMTVTNARMPASASAVLMALLPPVALLFSWWWLGTVPPALSIAGGAVSLAGVLLVTLRGRASAPAGEIALAPPD